MTRLSEVPSASSAVQLPAMTVLAPTANGPMSLGVKLAWGAAAVGVAWWFLKGRYS